MACRHIRCNAFFFQYLPTAYTGRQNSRLGKFCFHQFRIRTFKHHFEMEKPNVSSASRMIFSRNHTFRTNHEPFRLSGIPVPGKKCCFHCFTSLHKLSIMTIKLWLLNPTHYITAPGKTGTESCNHDDIAMFYFPLRTASSSAIPTDAAEVFPYLSTFTYIWSLGIPTFLQ